MFFVPMNALIPVTSAPVRTVTGTELPVMTRVVEGAVITTPFDGATVAADPLAAAACEAGTVAADALATEPPMASAATTMTAAAERPWGRLDVRHRRKAAPVDGG